MTAAPTTPTTSRVSSGLNVTSSPHYTTTRRHSLYGTEDRIILDPGSRVWKVGFSGEGRPRDVFAVDTSESGSSLWTSTSNPERRIEREEEERLLRHKLQDRIRAVFTESLLTDPKSRKVIIIEHPLLPLYVKDIIARILFQNLQVPSISFAPSHLLALLSTGRITGLVLDSGHLESTVLPVYTSRPLFPLLRTTPLAGARLTSHLRSLLIQFGTYLPPTSLVGASTAARSTRIPPEILTDVVVEDIKSRCCFVGDSIAPSGAIDGPTDRTGMASSDSAAMELSSVGDIPHSVSRMSRDVDPPSRSASRAPPSPNPEASPSSPNDLTALATLYEENSTATDLKFRIVPPHSPGIGAPGATTRGTLVVPGWIRERSAEILFQGGDVDENSVAEIVLDALLKVPVDLRKDMISSIVVAGGTAMLPGFIPRLNIELKRLLTTPPTTTTRSQTSRVRTESSSPSRSGSNTPKPIRPPYDPYAVLRPLAPFIAIVNNTSPGPSGPRVPGGNTGKAPAFAPAALPWVGGSLAGALKTGGEEILREQWDEAFEQASKPPEPDPSVAISTPPAIAQQDTRSGRSMPFILPDWTRGQLSMGAPSVFLTQQAAA